MRLFWFKFLKDTAKKIGKKILIIVLGNIIFTRIIITIFTSKQSYLTFPSQQL